MLNIVLFSLLVLNSGICSQDTAGNVENIVKPEEINENLQVHPTNNEPNNVVSIASNPDQYVTAKPPATVQTATKQPAPGLSLTPEQIDKLADKILMAHGVEPSPQTPQDYKRVQRLKNVVAKVENNLDNKLKETAEEAKKDQLKNEDEKINENPTTNGITEGVDININNENVRIEESIEKVIIPDEEPYVNRGNENIQGISNDENVDILPEENTITSNNAEETKNEVVNEEDTKKREEEVDVPTGENQEEKLDVIIENENEREKIQESQPEVIEENEEQEGKIEGVNTGDIENGDIINNNKEVEGIIEEAQISEEEKIDTDGEENKTEYVIEENLRDESKEDNAQESQENTDNSDNILEPTLEGEKIKEENEEEVDETDLETCDAEKNDCDQGSKKYLYSVDDNLIHDEKLETKVDNGYFDKILNFIYARF